MVNGSRAASRVQLFRLGSRTAGGLGEHPGALLGVLSDIAAAGNVRRFVLPNQMRACGSRGCDPSYTHR